MNLHQGTTSRATSTIWRFRPGAGTALLVAVVGLSLWGYFASPYFFTSANIYDTNLNLVNLGLLCYALAPVIVAGEIDVSTQGMLTLGGTTAGLLFDRHWPTMLVFMVLVLVGITGGAINAYLITRRKLPSLVVTLGGLILFNGIAAAELGPGVVSTFPTGIYNWSNGHAFFGFLPNITIVLLVVGVVESFVLHRTIVGRRLFFLGKNSEAAIHSGLDVAKYKAATFIYAGILSSLAGALAVIQVASATSNSNSNVLLPALTAVLLARVDTAGGKGNVLAILAAVYVLSILFDIQTLIGWGSEVGQITVGVVLVVSTVQGNLWTGLRQRIVPRRLNEPSS